MSIDSSTAELVSLIKPLAVRPGFVATHLPEVKVLSAFSYVASSPLIYDPSLMIVVQGRKVACLGPRTFEYGAGHYLIQALSVPFQCETFATPDKPLYGVAVAIDRTLLGELVQLMGSVGAQPCELQTPESMSSVLIDQGMRTSVERLLQCLQDPLECQVMGAARVRDVIFSALRGPQAGVLRALVEHHGQFARIAASVSYLHDHYDQALNVDTLARCANMSISTFHEHFKRSTLLSPVQYLKRLRLLKAQQLLTADGLGVGQVALKVGYQSASQFSREYKRYFARSPVEEGAHLRAS